MTWPGASHRLLARIRQADIHPADMSERPYIAALTLKEFVQAWLNEHDEAYDVVHAHSSIAGLVARRFPHPTARLVYSPHSPAFAGHRRRTVRMASRLVEQRGVKRTHAIGAVSTHEASLFSALGMPSGRIVVVPHAVTSDGWDRQPSRGKPRFVAVGRIGFQKRPELFLQLKQQWDDRSLPPADWVWVGDGEISLRNQLRSAGVQVTGWLPNATTRRLLGTATVYLHVARYEGLPIAALEAMASGAPVVGFDIPGLCDVTSITLVRHLDEAVKTLELLLDEDARAERVQRQDVELLQRFNAARQAARLSELYLAGLN